MSPARRRGGGGRKRRGAPKRPSEHSSQPTSRLAYSETREWLLKSHGPICAYCGVTYSPRSLTLDHVTPRKGQSAYDRRDNLVLACKRCNTAKADKPFLVFLLAQRTRAERLLRYGDHLSNGIKSAFTMTEFNPHRNWKWVGGFLWLTVHYDHRFEALTPVRTRLTWSVEAKGFGVSVFGKLFAKIYNKNLNRAIPLLIEEMAGLKLKVSGLKVSGQD